jgi:hypothetical protein
MARGSFAWCCAAVDTVEQVGRGHFQSFRQLGDGADARLAFAALDLRDVGHVEVSHVGETFLAELKLAPEAPQVGGEGVERVGHDPTMVGHLCQMYQIQL